MAAATLPSRTFFFSSFPLREIIRRILRVNARTTGGRRPNLLTLQRGENQPRMQGRLLLPLNFYPTTRPPPPPSPLSCTWGGPYMWFNAGNVFHLPRIPTTSGPWEHSVALGSSEYPASGCTHNLSLMELLTLDPFGQRVRVDIPQHTEVSLQNV